MSGENNVNERIVCFGHAKFILKTIDEFCDIVYEWPKDKSKEYFENNPFGDIL
jgi:hypothetical protein